jgi:predicted nucleic acid-binding protein
MRVGLGTLDATHLAFAEAAECDYLVTCDDRFIKKSARSDTMISVVNPIQLLKDHE